MTCHWLHPSWICLWHSAKSKPSHVSNPKAPLMVLCRSILDTSLETLLNPSVAASLPLTTFNQFKPCYQRPVCLSFKTLSTYASQSPNRERTGQVYISKVEERFNF